MSAQVTHQPRVAWDAARTFISFACSDSDAFAQFELLVDDVLGPRFREALVDSRSRLIGRSDTLPLVELGTWRVRFDDLLRSTPELTEALRVLAATQPTSRGADDVDPAESATASQL